MSTRRHFIAALAGLSAVAGRSTSGPAPMFHLATNQYPWFTFFQREKRDWSRDPDAALADVARAGLDGFEPLISAPEQITKLAPLLKKHRLEMRSLYMNAFLHEQDRAKETLRTVLAVADQARRVGLRIMVINPTPIRWGGQEDKSDTQLIVQASFLDELGTQLRKRHVKLAYHNHDVEMRRSAREFHHMMLGTNPAHVSLCLDGHWIFRGSGDSQVALFDIVKLYGSRIVELHLRQSLGGVWTEAFGPGDIDHARLVLALAERKIHPHIVLEQAIEARSPKTLTAVEAHSRGAGYARKVFAPLAG